MTEKNEEKRTLKISTEKHLSQTCLPLIRLVKELAPIKICGELINRVVRKKKLKII